jgi:hypothetical protein
MNEVVAELEIVKKKLWYSKTVQWTISSLWKEVEISKWEKLHKIIYKILWTREIYNLLKIDHDKLKKEVHNGR